MTIPAAAVGAYLNQLEAVDADGATALALGLLDAGADPVDVLLDLVAAAQREIGERWRTAGWNVAQEHAATHISESVITAVAGRIRPAPTRGNAVLACVEGEWHALAGRLVAEVSRAAGWRVTFLGASVPSTHLVSYVHQTGPHAVLLTCLQPSRLVRAARAIEACRLAGTPVIAGGPGFGSDGRWAIRLGAATWGATARDAPVLLDSGTAASVHPDPMPPQPMDEYRALRRRRGDLLAVAARAAGQRHGDDTAIGSEIDQLVDALEAAVRLDDPDLLAEHLRWQGGLLRVRGGPLGALEAALDACATVLVEHPRAGSYLDRARADAEAAG